MTTFSFGPTISYVTDPSLTMEEQTRVLHEVIQAAEAFQLRVAFRLPGASDEELDRLLNWYWNEEVKLNLVSGLQEPLLHYRPGLVGRYPDAAVWMPGRYLGRREGVSAYSVHNRQETELAVRSGASEAIFGHVFETNSHPDQAGRGINALLDARKSVCNEPGITFTAIGGINEGSMHAMGSTRMMSVACIRAISTSSDIHRTLNSMHQKWNRGFEESMEKGHQQ